MGSYRYCSPQTQSNWYPTSAGLGQIALISSPTVLRFRPPELHLDLTRTGHHWMLDCWTAPFSDFNASLLQGIESVDRSFVLSHWTWTDPFKKKQRGRNSNGENPVTTKQDSVRIFKWDMRNYNILMIICYVYLSIEKVMIKKLG